MEEKKSKVIFKINKRNLKFLRGYAALSQTTIDEIVDAMIANLVKKKQNRD